MEDLKLSNRKDNYRKCNFNIMETREKNNLSLRKQKIEEYIFKKRIKSNQNDPFSIEINPLGLGIDPEYKDFLISNIEKDIETIYEMLTSTADKYKKFAVYLLRQYFVHNEIEDKNACELFLSLNKHNILELLLDILSKSTDISMIFEVYWILINLPLKNIENILNLEIFCEDYMIEVYLKHLESEYLDISNNTLWFACRIVQESAKCRDKIISSKIYDEIVRILRKESNSADLMEHCLWLLTSFMKCRNTTPPKEKMIEILGIACNYLYAQDIVITSQCLWGIYYISAFHEEDFDLYSHIIDSGAVLKILNINFKKLHLCISPCIRILGNLASGKFDLVDNLLDWQILDFLENLMTFVEAPASLREIVWAISNISAGNINHCTKVVDSPIFRRIIEYLIDNDYKLRKEALCTVNNISTASLEMSLKMLNLGLFDKLCFQLGTEKSEELIFKLLDTVSNVIYTGECLIDLPPYFNTIAKKFDEMGGVTLVERMQSHKNEDIYNFSLKILERYYSTTQEIINN